MDGNGWMIGLAVTAAASIVGTMARWRRHCHRRCARASRDLARSHSTVRVARRTPRRAAEHTGGGERGQSM